MIVEGPYVKQSIFSWVVLLIGCIAISFQSNAAELPPSINNVETKRVGDHLIRLIRYNMELEPIIEIEVLTTPSVRVVNKMTIRGIDAVGEHLDFGDSDGTFVESAQIVRDGVDFAVEYFYSRGGSSIFECHVPVNGGQIGMPKCVSQ